MEKNVRLRILLVMELFFEKTDENHGVSMQNILSWLESNNLSGERKSVYEDIHALQQYGLDIRYFADDKTYRLAGRSMELAELKLLVDAIHASKFITKEKADEMIHHVEDMASQYQRSSLHREVYAEKPKSVSKAGFANMDILHEAITKNRQVTFQYLVWNTDKTLQEKHNGKTYCVSPWLMVWADENYYLAAYDGEEQKMKHFRVDKISNVVLQEMLREGEEEFHKIDTANYSTSHFGMYGGEAKRVSVRFANHLAGVVLDRFGTEIQILKEDEEHFKAALPVVVSNQFFGWIFGLGNQVQILTEDVAKQYKQYLEETLSLYR
ncbi:MAG: WYL domain-containing protein [Butyribacter sp.]|nr:WYL domain-containing protein [bacterium]MDY3854269.1 WYL domain-containing protein [Butyribacter sp.]